jgi:hypothetical protein
VTARHPAGTAHYRGDLTAMVGEIHGPTTFGTHLIAASAEYDAASDRTTATFVTATEDDLRTARADADRRRMVVTP